MWKTNYFKLKTVKLWTEHPTLKQRAKIATQDSSYVVIQITHTENLRRTI